MSGLGYDPRDDMDEDRPDDMSLDEYEWRVVSEGGAAYKRSYVDALVQLCSAPSRFKIQRRVDGEWKDYPDDAAV